ncbi:MAG: deoxyribodipyrimidine photo-lyase [Brevinematia bacterium]
MKLFLVDKRIKKLNDSVPSSYGKYVLYCMEASQRISYNYALLFAITQANSLGKPVVVLFNITDKYRYSNARYYKFMLEGIIKLKKDFEELGIKFHVRYGDYVSGCVDLGFSASLVVLDRNYLTTHRRWRQEVASRLTTAVFEVDNDVVVPVEFVSSKAEPYAYVIRNKIYPLINEFVDVFSLPKPFVNSCNLDLGEEFYFEDVDTFLAHLNVDKTVPVVNTFIGGYDQARRLLEEFISNKLYRYKEFRNDPTKDYQSNLSPYLHFGNISPVEILYEILRRYDLEDENVRSYVNELVVWRELARNFVYYTPNYNRYEGIPSWARNTLEEHKNDKRDYVYTLEEFEGARTHDVYWNSAQKELLKTGKMHGYMRMYWAKKILEWTKSPEEAFNIVCYLNDKYELDGRDPNGYAGISWCFGNFDRPFAERKVLGRVRYMSARGLEDKFDIKKYVEKYS